MITPTQQVFHTHRDEILAVLWNDTELNCFNTLPASEVGNETVYNKGLHLPKCSTNNTAEHCVSNRMVSE